MTESLDGGEVTYRSNRQFDMLNENLIYYLQSAASASDYRNAFDGRRTATARAGAAQQCLARRAKLQRPV